MSTGLRAGTNNDGYLQVNGTDVLTALSSGRIGIGTDNPSAKLEVASTSLGSKIRVKDSAGYGDLLIYNNEWSFQLNGSEKVRIENNGNVGIGTENPSEKLHIIGTGNTFTRVDSISGSDTTQTFLGSIAGSGLGYLSVSNTGSLSSYTDFKINVAGTNMISVMKQSGTNMVSIGNSSSSAATFDGLEVQGNFGINGGIIFDSQRNISRSLRPSADATYDWGSASFRWANIYSADLQLSNEGSQNDVDGTWGTYTIQEGEDDLFLLNRRNGKKYKFVLQEVN